jgi:MOSC domain-containing protein YiiM
MPARIIAVARSLAHTMSKAPAEIITLAAGFGVEGDAHNGVTVKHRSRVAKDPNRPNLRQVHLIHIELLDELRGAGFDLAPGEMGENITTDGIALLNLPSGTRLRLGSAAVVQITGLRNPCTQLDKLRPGLRAATLDRDAEGKLRRKAGVMAIVLEDGDVRPGDSIRAELPPLPHLPLEPV